MKKPITNLLFSGKSFVWVLLLLFIVAYPAKAQYVKTQGNQILDPNGNPIFFKGMNLGNWLLWEGYLMMGDYNYRTHTQFFNSMKSAFGGNQTQALDFEHQWRMNYVTEQAIIDLKNLGFNSVRVPFHYNMFWNGSTVTNNGFQYFDRLVTFCRAQGMYVLLDMHAAPGYQNPGDHSDNVESNASQPRNTVHFWDGNNVSIASQVWRHIANYYKNEPVIWGYDLINEPVPQPGREYELLNSMITMRNAIRQVDNNHIVVAEGSWWGSDMQKLDWTDPQTQSSTGVNARWDNNLVYQTHHYSSDVSMLTGRLAITNKLGVPLILGEYGENSDAMLRQMTDWCVNNKVGYFPWSFKKMIHDKCLWTIPSNANYDAVRNYINSGGTPPANAYNNMISFCNNNIANGKPGIIFHQSWYDAVKPPVPSTRFALPGTIQAEGFSAQSGIQTETTSDSGGGQNIGFIETGDWTEYLVNVETVGNYTIQYRVASTGTTGQIQLRNGSTTYATTNVPNTNGWQTWATVTATASLPAGQHTFRLYFSGGGFNLNWLGFSTASNPTTPAAPAGLTATAGNSQVSLSWTASSGASSYTVKRSTTSGGSYADIATGVSSTSYVNTALTNGTTYFYVVSAVNSVGASGNSNQASATPVNNTTINAFTTIQAESFSSQSGLQTEACSDTGGGLNVGFTDTNDYLLFNNVDFGSGAASVDVRLASGASFTGTAQFRLGSTTGTIIGTASFGNTGGWQTWTTRNTAISGVSGIQNLYVIFQGGNGIGNVNWIKFNAGTATVPSVPANLSAASGNAQITLTWSASSGATSYTVKRAGTTGGPYTDVASGLTSTNYTNTGLTNGITYYYVVSASNTVGQSGNSSQVSANPSASSSLIANGIYKITSKSNLKSMDVADVSANNGARIQQWDYNGATNQQWRVESLGGGLYKITAVNSSKSLDVVDNSTSSGAEIQQWEYLGNPNQKWKIEDQGSGFYRFVASHSNKVLNTPSANNGIKLTQADWTNTDNQKWKVELLQSISGRVATSNSSLLLDNELSPFTADVYPNPSTNSYLKVRLKGASAKTLISIFNSNGKVIFSKSVESDINEIDVDTLKAGLYIIKIQNSKADITKRIIIK